MQYGREHLGKIGRTIKGNDVCYESRSFERRRQVSQAEVLFDFGANQGDVER